jgi:hypothetical protein
VETVAALIAALREGDWPLIRFGGSGARRYRESLLDALDERARWIPPPLDDPGADALALAGAEAWRAGEPGLDPLGAGPVYLRPSDAERRQGIDLSDVLPEPQHP